MSVEFEAVGNDIQEVAQQHVIILDLSANKVTSTLVRYLFPSLILNTFLLSRIKGVFYETRFVRQV